MFAGMGNTIGLRIDKMMMGELADEETAAKERESLYLPIRERMWVH